MKKYFLGFLMLFLLINSAFAYSASIRGSEGKIDYVNDYTNLYPEKIKLSMWNNKDNGQASLEVIGETMENKRVVLNVGFDKSGKGIAAYYMQGLGEPQRYSVIISHSYNPLTGKITIMGNGGIKFKISEINKNILWAKGDCIKPLEPGCDLNSDCGSQSSEISCDGDYLKTITTTPTCNEGVCENTTSETNSFCEFGCSEDECLPEPAPECVLDTDCPADFYIENYCSLEGNVVKDLHNFSCMNEQCAEEIVQENVQTCANGCLNGTCLEPSLPIHDIGFVNFTNSFNKIFLEYKNGTDIIVENPVLNCGDVIKAKVRVKNNGNFTENVSLAGLFNGVNLNFNEISNFTQADTSDRTTLSPYINLTSVSAGTYTISIEAIIDGFTDANPLDNTASRNIEVVC